MTLAAQIWLWNSQSNLGVAFDSSTGFKLSNNAVRSPDVTWVKLERWNELTAQQQDKYAPIDPDFVIELKSPSDDWQELQAKMTEYMNCDVKLGWLIDPEDKLVEIYRQGQDKEILNNPQTLSGEEILPGLTVNLTEIF
ncbi:MAG: Uma2 family endonuclease [Cyanobacteria bacterium J06582_2]